MIELGVVMLLGLLVIAVCALAAAVKAVLWVVLLPFRLLFWIVAGAIVIPLLALKVLLAGLLMLAALPLVLASAVAVLALGLFALLLPLLPVVLLVALVWYLVADQPRALVRG